MIRLSTRTTHQRCIGSRESDFDKPPGHFGSGVCFVKCRAHGGNRGKAAGWLAAWSNADAVFCLLSGPRAEAWLRAKRRFLGFARKMRLSVTGKMAISWDLPVKCSPPLRAKRRFLNSARKTQFSVTGKTPIFEFCP